MLEIEPPLRFLNMQNYFENLLDISQFEPMWKDHHDYSYRKWNDDCNLLEYFLPCCMQRTNTYLLLYPKIKRIESENQWRIRIRVVCLGRLLQFFVVVHILIPCNVLIAYQ